MSSPPDRAGAWFYTGPLGRLVAFVVDLSAAWLGWALSKLRRR